MDIIIKKIGKEYIDEMADIEAACFPAAEAATKESFTERFKSSAFLAYGAFYENRMIGFIDGALYDKPELPDILYEDITKLVEDGKWQTVFGVNVLPEYRRKKIASKMINFYIDEARQNHKEGLVLTCKDYLRPLYEGCGFVWQGRSASTHGNAQWNDMIIKL